MIRIWIMTHTGEFNGERIEGEYKVPMHFSMIMVLF
jgi:hypothetical protein